MITTAQYTQAAGLIGCDTPAVKAAAFVEGGKTGFYASGKIILKFEGHVFHMYTKGKFDQSHPTLSYPRWTERFSAFGEDAYLRFNDAFNLDPHAAMLSTSWGMFQVMGENYSSCGCRSVDELITFLKQDEDNHLVSYCRYLKAERIDRFLIAHDWDAYAYRYNGSLYQKDDYAGQLRRAYQKFLTS